VGHSKRSTHFFFAKSTTNHRLVLSPPQSSVVQGEQNRRVGKDQSVRIGFCPTSKNIGNRMMFIELFPSRQTIIQPKSLKQECPHTTPSHHKTIQKPWKDLA